MDVSRFRAVEENSVCSVNKQDGAEEFIAFLGSENTASLPEMVVTRVIPSFLSAVKRYRVRSFGEESLRIWFVAMVIRGMKFNQAKRYLGALHTVFTDWNSTVRLDDPFPAVNANLASPIAYDAETAVANADGLRRFFEIAADNESSVPLNVFLYLLYDVEAEFEDVVRLPIDHAKYDCQQISDLISRIPRKKRASYAFPLNQGNTTDKRIISLLQYEVGALLEKARISFDAARLRDSIRSLWIAKALGCGVSFAAIRNLIPTLPEEYRILGLATPARLDGNERNEVICRVADHICDTTVRWYIMRMRQKVTPDMVKEEMKTIHEDIYASMDFYYPVYQTLEIDKAKKRKVVDHPFLPGVLFIRLRSDKVDYVVKRVTKYAWCYKWSRNPDSPYSSMSQKQMEAFQMHISRLTPDIRMMLEVRETPYERDTEVMISGGDRMVGHVGRITSVRNADGTRTYSLEITNDLSAKWTVKDVDEMFLQPVESK